MTAKIIPLPERKKEEKKVLVINNDRLQKALVIIKDKTIPIDRAFELIAELYNK